MFQAEEAGQKVDHHICVSHLPRLASPGTDSQLQEHQDSIKVSRENIGTVPAPNDITQWYNTGTYRYLPVLFSNYWLVPV